MGKEALEIHGGGQQPPRGILSALISVGPGRDTGDPTREMERAYHAGEDAKVTDQRARALIRDLKANKWGAYSFKSEAAYAAACLVRAGRLELGLEVANAVARAMGNALGGGMHGSYELLAYLQMVIELRKAGVVTDKTSLRLKVDGEELDLAEALKRDDIESIEASGGPVALKLTRLERLRFDEVRAEVPISIDIKDASKGKTLREGKPVRLTVSLDEGYTTGDVLCVTLPECLSRMVSGAKTKKFQVDFSGAATLEVDLLAHAATPKPQRWSAVVRNMYDGGRIGSVGLLEASVASRG